MQIFLKNPFCLTLLKEEESLPQLCHEAGSGGQLILPAAKAPILMFSISSSQLFSCPEQLNR